MTDIESLNARLRQLQAQFNAETDINKRNDISVKIKLKIRQLEG